MMSSTDVHSFNERCSMDIVHIRSLSLSNIFQRNVWLLQWNWWIQVNKNELMEERDSQSKREGKVMRPWLHQQNIIAWGRHLFTLFSRALSLSLIPFLCPSPVLRSNRHWQADALFLHSSIIKGYRCSIECSHDCTHICTDYVIALSFSSRLSSSKPLDVCLLSCPSHLSCQRRTNRSAWKE